MKLVVTFLLVVSHSVLSAQSISIRIGHTLVPADNVSLRYEHWANGAFNLSLGGFMELSHQNNLNYSVYGIDLLTEYASNPEGYTGGVFGLRCGAGVGLQVENEPWVYKDWQLKKRTGWGLLGELSGEWFMTDHFTLRATIQQKILFNPDLGHYRFLIGLGLSCRLGSY